MRALQRGAQVQHASLGQGKVVAADPQALHVFFPGSRSRFAAKLRLPEAMRFLRLDGFEPDGPLQELSAFAFDEQAGRWGLHASWLPREEAIARYRARGARRTRTGAPERRDRWALATQRWSAHLGGAALGRLLDAGDVEGAVRRIVALERFAAPLLGQADQGALAAALADPATAAAFLTALVPVLEGAAPGRARVEALFRASHALPGAPEQRWLVATLLPFVAAPGGHVLLRPRATAHALERLGIAFAPGDAPAWATYAALRATSAGLLEALAPHGAEDFADVECFLHFTATTTAREPGRGGARRAEDGSGS